MLPSVVARSLAALVVTAVLLIFSTGTSVSAAMEAFKVLSEGGQQNLHPRLSLPGGAVVLVTGGAGFVGFHLCMRLHQSGVRVLALDNFDPYYSLALKHARADQLKQAGIEVVEADLCDQALVSQLIDKAQVTHIASMAAQAGVRYSLVRPQAYARANVQCFLALLEALRRRPAVRLVYASSSSVYGANTKTPFAEDDRTDSPNSLYAATKKTNEQFAHVYHGLYGIHVTGLRFFTVYGPWVRNLRVSLLFPACDPLF